MQMLPPFERDTVGPHTLSGISDVSLCLIRLLLCSLTLTLGCTVASAGDRNRLYGCVTDAAGRPISDAKVIARRTGVTETRGKEDWKVGVQRSTGCYEIVDLPEGTYVLHLVDKNYDGQFGPAQGTVRLGAADSGEVNLISGVPLPDGAKLTDGLASVFVNAANDFTQIRGRQFTDLRDAVTHGSAPGWYAAPILSGFSTCFIAYTAVAAGILNKEGYTDAIYHCDLQGVGGDVAKAIYSKVRDIIATTLSAKFPQFGPPKRATCNYAAGGNKCTEGTEWSSQDTSETDSVGVSISIHQDDDPHVRRRGQKETLYRLKFDVSAVKQVRH